MNHRMLWIVVEDFVQFAHRRLLTDSYCNQASAPSDSSIRNRTTHCSIGRRRHTIHQSAFAPLFASRRGTG